MGYKILASDSRRGFSCVCEEAVWQLFEGIFTCTELWIKLPSSWPSRTVSYIIRPNTSTKVVTKLCRQPFKVSCLISYRSLGAAHTRMGVNLPFRGPLSFAASHQNVVPLKEIKEEARSFGEEEEWDGKKGMVLSVCQSAPLLCCGQTSSFSWRFPILWSQVVLCTFPHPVPQLTYACLW